MPAAPGSHPSTAERTASPALKLEAEGLCLRLLRYLRVDVAPSTRLLLVSRNNGGTFGRMRTTEYTGRTCPLLVRTGLVAAFLAAGVVAGEQSACADGIVRCWGYNYYGQCDTPADLGPCSSFAGGYLYTIALRSDGRVRCWGNNYYGQCNTPADLGPCSSVAGGESHTIALRSDGGVRCWGNNTWGQCNTLADLTACSSIAGGSSHTIALRSDGGVRCWGANASGQCNTPADLGPCSSVAGGSAHTIALQIDGGVRCWGANVWGQCDTPADFTARSSIAGGNAHTIALEAACPQCPSSLTGNCTVDGADLGNLLNGWGSCPL